MDVQNLKYATININGTATNITESDDLQEFEINSSCYVNDKFIGTTVAKKTTVKLLDDGTYNLEDKDINIKTGIEINNVKEFQKLGTYTIPKPDTEEVSGNMSFTGYDYMKKFDTLYVDNNTYPIRLDACLENLCSQVGLLLGNKNFPNNSYMLKGNPFTNRETRKTVLSNLVQLTGGFAEIDAEDGKLYVRNLDVNGEAVETIDGNNYDEFKPNNVFGPVNSVRILMNSGVDGEETIKEAEGVTDENRCQITIADNYYLTSAEEREAVINAIFNALKGLTYLPIELSYYGYPWLKLGDKIKVKDKNDNEYATYVMEHILKYNGAYSGTIKAIALTKTQQAYKEVLSLKEWRRNTELAVDKINGKITAVAEETTENSEKITKVEQDVNGIDTKVSSVEKSVENITNTEGEATGKSIHLEDSSDEELVSIKVKGETNQATRSGKNKCKITISSQTKNGLDVVVNADKTILINGTATANTLIRLSEEFNIPSGTYYLSGCPQGGSSSTYKLYLNAVSGQDLGEGNIITLSKEKNTCAVINISEGVVCNNLLFKPQLEIGSTATDYEAPGVSPSPDYPSEIENVEGKNKFNKAVNYIQLYMDQTIIVTNTNDYLGYIKCKPNTKYSITKAKTYAQSFYIGSTNVFPSNNVNVINGVISSNPTKYENYITPANAEYLVFRIGPEGNGITLNEMLDNIQVEEGPQATSYVPYNSLEIKVGENLFDINNPYKSQVVTFPLGNQKLMEGSYLASDGIHNKRKQVVFDGSDDESWIAYTATSVDGYVYCTKAITDCKIGFNTSICSHFKNKNYAWDVGKIGEYSDHPTLTYKYFVTDKASITDWKLWLSQNPITIEYELLEEEIIPYTAEQQEAWDKIEQLHTYKNVTNIFSDAELDIVYVRDNGLSDMYETKQNANKKYAETSEKLTEQKMTVDGVITQVSDITSKTDELTGEVKTINSEISTVKQTVEGWSSDLKNTGGNNIFYYSLDFWDNSNGLEEYSDTEIIQNSLSQTGYALNNGSAKQTQSVKNGFYTCSFNYKKLLELAVCQVKINDTIYNLTEADWAEFEQAFEVKTNIIEIEFISDTDSSLYISDLMINVGKTKLSWSQNANETRTDTVTIGKGIQVNSSVKNTCHRIDADGNRTFNKTTGKVVNEATDKGSEMEELIVRGQAKINGLLIQKVSNQVWINSLL